MMPTIGMSQLYYEFICLQMAFDNSTIYFKTAICIIQFY